MKSGGGQRNQGREVGHGGGVGGAAPERVPPPRRIEYVARCTYCGRDAGWLLWLDGRWHVVDVVGCDHVTRGEVRRFMFTKRGRRRQLQLPLKLERGEHHGDGDDWA